jgi:hypothetical protein
VSRDGRFINRKPSYCAGVAGGGNRWKCVLGDHDARLPADEVRRGANRQPKPEPGPGSQTPLAGIGVPRRVSGNPAPPPPAPTHQQAKETQPLARTRAEKTETRALRGGLLTFPRDARHAALLTALDHKRPRRPRPLPVVLCS